MYQFSELKFSLAAVEVDADDWHRGAADKRDTLSRHKVIALITRRAI